MENTLLLANEIKLFRIGLGTNRMQDDDTSRQALVKAVELGINFIDTAGAYTAGVSEKVIGQTLAPYKGITIATKGGMQPPDFHVDGRPEKLQEQLESSLQKLQLKQIPLYFLHRVDPNVPFIDQLNFLKQAQDEGKIKHIGLSEVSVAQIEEARKTIEVAAVENEYNLSQRKYDDVLSYAEKENIVFVPFYPLHFSVSDQTTFQKLLEKYSVTAEQLALAWLLKRSPVMLPIPGSRSLEHLEENVKAADIKLDDTDFNALSQLDYTFGHNHA